MRQRFAEAILDGDRDTVAELLAEAPDLVEFPVPEGFTEQRVAGLTPLHLSIEGGDADIVRLLLDAGADPRAKNEQGRTPLHDAVEFGRDDLAQVLVDHGAELDVCLAAILGEAEILRELLAAEPELANDRSTDLSPLGWAAYGDQVESAEVLLEAGARMDDGALLCAASVGHVDVGRFLLENGADPNEIHPGAGGTALHAAASMRYTDDSSAFVELLLEHGADPAIRSLGGKTALEIARAGLEREEAEEPECPRRFDRVVELLQRFET